MAQDFPPMTDLIPHRQAMCLIGDVVAESEDVLTVSVEITAGNPFLVPGQGVPAYVAMEILAQTICARDGMDRWRSGQAPEIGFLLGSQRFRTYCDWLQVGDALTARVTCRLDGGELGSFDCELQSQGGELLAKGTINVYRPRDMEAYLAQDWGAA